MSKLFGVLLAINFLLLAVFSSVSVLAQEENSTISAKIKKGGSYELFWPLSSGKTIEDRFYFLKLWKEDVLGMFIFEEAQKADYEVRLVTKRILEAEKLLKEGKEDSAAKTLDKASAQLILARGKFSKATRAGKDFQLKKINLTSQLSNLDEFLPKLAILGKTDSQNKSEKILETVKQFLGDTK